MNKRIKKKKEKQKELRRKKFISMSIDASLEFNKAFPVSEELRELHKKINSRSPRKLTTVTQNLSDFLSPEEIAVLKAQDLRGIISDGREQGKSAYESLKDAGFIKEPQEFL